MRRPSPRHPPEVRLAPPGRLRRGSRPAHAPRSRPRRVAHLADGAWIDRAENLLITGATALGPRAGSPAPSATRPAATGATSPPPRPPALRATRHRPRRRPLRPHAQDAGPHGPVRRAVLPLEGPLILLAPRRLGPRSARIRRTPRPCSRSSRIATAGRPPSSATSSPSTPGTRSSATRPSLTPSSTVWSTTPTVSNSPEKACGDAPTATPRLTPSAEPDPMSPSVEAAAHDRVDQAPKIRGLHSQNSEHPLWRPPPAPSR